MRTLPAQLSNARHWVDACDERMLYDLIDRFMAVADIAKIKAKMGNQTYDPAREVEQVARLRQILRERGRIDLEPYILEIFQHIRDTSRTYQRHLNGKQDYCI